jgi:hypothetical protein
VQVPDSNPALFVWESQRDEQTCDLCSTLDGRQMDAAQVSLAFYIIISLHRNVVTLMPELIDTADKTFRVTKQGQVSKVKEE